MQKLIQYIFLSALISAIFYSYYSISSIFYFRMLSAITMGFFYLCITIYFGLHFKKRFKNRSGMLSIFYILLILVLIPFSLQFNYEDILTLLFHPYSFSGFFMGILLFLVNKDSIIFLSKISRIMSSIIMLITLLDILIFQYPVFLMAGYSFIIFDYLITKEKKRKFWNLILLFITIPTFLFYDIRAAAMICTLILLLLLVFYIFRIFKRKFLRMIFLLITLSSVYIVFFNFTIIFEYFTPLISNYNISTIDTRSFLLIEFFEDVKGMDLIFGRGYLGSYYSQYFQNWSGENGDHFQRFNLEIGFLQIILKGGLILLVTMLAVFIKSIYKGMTNSVLNSFNFQISIWLLVEFCMMAIENVPAFTIHFFFIWIITGILSNNQKNKPIKLMIAQ